MLVRSPYVDNVMLHLDPINGQCAALAVVNQAALEQWAKTSGISFSSFGDLCSKPEARKEVLASVRKVSNSSVKSRCSSISDLLNRQSETLQNASFVRYHNFYQDYKTRRHVFHISSYDRFSIGRWRKKEDCKVLRFQWTSSC